MGFWLAMGFFDFLWSRKHDEKRDAADAAASSAIFVPSASDENDGQSASDASGGFDASSASAGGDGGGGGDGGA